MPEHRKSEVFLTFLRLGLYAFGGPTAHFALFRRRFVQDRAWLSPAHYDGYLALCHFLPGPGSSQMAAVLGWVRAGPAGAVLAMLGFALPSLIIMTAAGITLPLLDPDLAERVGNGLMAGVAAVVAGAVWAMLKTTAKHPVALMLAGASAIALLAAGAMGGVTLWLQPGVLLACALLGGIVLSRSDSASPPTGLRPAHRTGAVIAIALFGLLLVGFPVLADEGTALQLAGAVYRAGALVFGGGHVVLPLLEAGTVPDLVEEAEFLAGYGLAQAVPGPLFSFAAFVGAASGDAPATAVLLAGLAAGVIFLPGLLLVFAVLPIWRRLQSSRQAQGVIAGAAAGATGILTAAFVDPVLTSLPVDAGLYALAFAAVLALHGARLSPPLVMAGCATAGLVLG